MEKTPIPLVSVILRSYNQRSYIIDTIESIINQSYKNIEIVISDDASTDGSIKLINSLYDRYHEDVKIILNMNHVNQGVSENINRAVEKCNGKLIVFADGDDISLPNRISTIVDYWRENNYCSASFTAPVINIDKDNNKLSVKPYSGRSEKITLKDTKSIVEHDGWFIGASAAFTKDIFDKFGPLDKGVVFEDAALILRSSIIGKVIIIDEPLVYYRQVGMISSTSDNLDKKIRTANYAISSYHQRIKDLIFAKDNNLLSDTDSDKYIISIKRYIARDFIRLSFYQSDNLSKKRESIKFSLECGYSIFDIFILILKAYRIRFKCD